jgi:hypothetical protein
MLYWSVVTILSLLDLFLAAMVHRFIGGKGQDFWGFLLCVPFWPVFLAIHWGYTLGDRLDKRSA